MTRNQSQPTSEDRTRARGARRTPQRDGSEQRRAQPSGCQSGQPVTRMRVEDREPRRPEEVAQVEHRRDERIGDAVAERQHVERRSASRRAPARRARAARAPRRARRAAASRAAARPARRACAGGRAARRRAAAAPRAASPASPSRAGRAPPAPSAAAHARGGRRGRPSGRRRRASAKKKRPERTSLRSAIHATDSTRCGCSAKSAATKALRAGRARSRARAAA